LPYWLQIFAETLSTERLASLFLPRIAIEPNETVWRPNQTALESEAKLAEVSDWIKYFNKQGEGFRPSTFNLRLARLSGQRLPKAYFESAQLEGANLSNTQLYKANLKNANIQRGNLELAQLQEANLSGAQLQGSYMWLTQMQGVSARKVNFMCAELGSSIGAAITRRAAQLQGADLSHANFQGAALEQVDFRGADLSWAELQHSKLFDTKFNGAIFNDTELSDTGTNPAFISRSEKAMISHIYSSFGKILEGTSPNWAAMRYWAKILSSEEIIQLSSETRLVVIDAGCCQLCGDPSPSGTYIQGTYIQDDQVIYQTVIPELCKMKGSRQSRLAAVRGIRENYSIYEDTSPPVPTEIDKVLCTIPQCVDIKQDIEGLNCTLSGSAKKKVKN